MAITKCLCNCSCIIIARAVLKTNKFTEVKGKKALYSLILKAQHNHRGVSIKAESE
jgi:hypothetical protein